MTKDDIITKLERAQDLLAEVYHYAITLSLIHISEPTRPY